MNDGALAPAVLDDGSVGVTAPAELVEACGLPEIGPLISSLSVRVDADQLLPVSLEGGHVTLAEDVASDVARAAVALREAAELAAVAEGSPRWSHRIVALATAATYEATSLRQRVPRGLPRPDPLAPAVQVDDLVEAPSDTAQRLARFLEERDLLSPCPAAELAAAARALPLAMPTEVLLTLGGDHRNTVDWRRGVNSYGISPRPAPWRYAFGSCTASAPTQRSFAAAQRLRRSLIQAALDDCLDAEIAAATAGIRQTLGLALGVADEAPRIVLTPSGTDSELIAAAVARSDAPLTSIVVAPTEIGSGSVNAAGGRHFSDQTADGAPADPGQTLDGFGDDDIDIVEIAVRRPDGKLIDPRSVEAAIDRAIRAAPGRVLLHVVEGSKTGVRLPRSATVTAWQRREGDRLVVLVDAAQMRIDQRTAVAHLRSGRMVLVTGSKFFGGPPFSGALLVPESLAGEADPATWPSGLARYVSENDVPVAMPGLRGVARPGTNIGLLLRWQAALTEMRSFHNASAEIRDRIIRTLAAGLRDALEASPAVEIVESPYTRIDQVGDRTLDDLPTIFTFLVRRPNGRLLDYDQARLVHRLLSEDISAQVGPEGTQLAARCFHLGQPVRIARTGDRWISALRFAIGATTVSTVVFDFTRGERWEDRIATELASISQALDKLALILEAVDLDRFGDGPPAARPHLVSVAQPSDVTQPV